MRKGILPTAFLAACILVFQTLSAQNTSPFWSLAGNSNASATTSKLGTTNSIPLRFFTNNAERMRLDAANGRLGIGTVNPQQRLHVEGGTLLNIFVSTSPLGATSGAGMIGYTKFLPTAAGHRLGYFLLGSRGGAESNYNAAGMAGYAGGSWTAGSSHPAYLTFETTPAGSSTRQERMRIAANGNVGIGIAAPSAPLDVVSQNAETILRAYSDYTGASDRRALFASSVNAPGYGYGVDAYGGYRGIRGVGQGADYSGEVVGVYGTASGAASSGTRHGVHGYATGGVTAFGIYGEGVNASSFNAAGYFAGNVYADNYYATSDRKFKKDIAPVKDALSQVMKLKPSTYQFKEEEYKSMGLPGGAQIGLVADEVKQVFPQLVQKAIHPARYDEEDRTKMLSPEVAYEAVNYQGLIPVLVAALQEQQKENEQLMDRIAKLEEMVGKLTASQPAPLSLNNASLSQSTPNPASGTTRINYSLPAGTQNARLLLTDNLGRTIRTMPLAGSGSIDIETASLSSGVYHYSLIIDGRRLETRKLTVVR